MKKLIIGKQAKSNLEVVLLIVICILIFGASLVDASIWDGVIHYFDFKNESAMGTNVPNLANGSSNGTLEGYSANALNWTTGIINNAYRFNKTADGRINVSNAEIVYGGYNFSISMWFRNESGTDAKFFMQTTPSLTGVQGALASGQIDFQSVGGSIRTNTTSTVKSGWNHYVVTMDGVSNTTKQYINGILTGTDTANNLISNASLQAVTGFVLGANGILSAEINATIDEFGIWAKILDQSDVSTLYNSGIGITYLELGGNISVNLVSPEDSDTIDDVGINFSASYASTGNLNLTNATYYLWNSTALFNNSVTMIITNQANSTSRYIDDFVLDAYTWNVYACSQNTSITICDFASENRTLNVGASVGSATYLNRTYETSNEQFNQNITLLAGATLYDVNVVYNGTTHTGTFTDLGSDAYDLESKFDLPRHTTSTNMSFFWRLTYERTDGSFLFQNLTTRNQTVSPINMSHCKSSDAYNDNRTLNFTSSFEVNETDVTTFDFYGTFQYWLGTGNVRKNLSINSAGINNISICINPRNLTYYSDTVIQYEKTSYVKRNYYLVNSSLTNSTNDIALFLLDNTLSTTFIIDVIDSVRVAVADAYIYIQRYYPGTNSFHTVEMARTDEGGSTVGHFEVETEDYKIIIVKDGDVVYESETQKIAKKETPYTLTFQIEAGPSTTWQDIGDLNNLVWSLTFNNATSLWTYTYVDTSGTTEQGRLWVYTDSPNSGKTTICNVTSTSSAATLTCDVSAYNETTYAAAYISRSPEILVWLSTHVRATLRWVFSYEGLFWGAMIIMALGFMGYATGNPSIGIIMTVVGVVGVNFLKLVSFGLGTIFGIIAIAIILLWEMKS